jgi:HSP20 family molecular chaperone IbpA
MPEKFDPSRELANLRNYVGRVIEQGVQSVQSLGNNGIKLDVYEVEGIVYVRTSAIDGVVSDLEINIEDGVLTISGDTRPEPTPTNASYVVQERRFGPFSRSVTLTIPVRSSEAEGQIKDGVILIKLPVDKDRYQNFKVTSDDE